MANKKRVDLGQIRSLARAAAGETGPDQDNKQPEPGKKPKKPATTPFTVRLPAEIVDRLKAAAFWQRRTISAMTAAALQAYVHTLEEENGGPFRVPPQNL